MNKKIFKTLIILIIVIQFIPYGRKHTNPQIVSEPEWNSLETRDLFFQTCKDCHSNETEWPWYSNIAPISWLIQYDVNEGREHFNVSMWGIQKRNEGEEAAEELQEGAFSPNPCPYIAPVVDNISGIPGLPFGPSYLITTTSPGLIFLSRTAFKADGSSLKHFAFPLNF